MTLLILFQNDLQYYSKSELIRGSFLFLTHDKQISVIPKDFLLFKCFVIYQKNFCPDNELYILDIYKIYVDICINKKQVTDNKWLSKTSFNVIKFLSPNQLTILYYIDRGYSEECGRNTISLLLARRIPFPENKWEQFVSNLELVPRKRLSKINRINAATGNYYTQEEINNIKKLQMLKIKNKHNIDLKAECYLSSIISLLYDNNGALLDTPVSYDEFKDFLIKEYNVNSNNIEFIKGLYNIYIKKFENYDFLIIPSYYKYGIFFEFEHKQSTIISKYYWLNRGYSEDETNNIISDIQKNNAISKDKLITTYGDIEGNKMYNEYLLKKLDTRNINKKNNPLYGVMYSKTIDPLTGEYYTGERLVEKRKEVCSANFYKATLLTALRIKEGKLKTVWQKEYWILHGYTEEEALNKVISIMPKTNVEWFIKKYGEKEGIIRYNKRIEKYKKTMLNKTLEEKLEIIKKRTKKPHKVSKTSILFFNEVLKRLEKENIVFNTSDIYMNTNEYHIYDKENATIYFYDFCIPKIKVIIEYNGIKYHPLPTLNEEELKNWKSLFYGISGTVLRTKDIRKEELAISRGFDFLTIWDNDEIEYSITKAIELIKNNYIQ